MINRETGKLRYSSRCRNLLSVACLRVGNKTARLPPALTVIFTRIRYEQYPTSIFQFPHVRLVHKRIFPWLHFFVYHEHYHRHHTAQQLLSVCWISILLSRARASSRVKSSWCSTFGTAHMLHILLLYYTSLSYPFWDCQFGNIFPFDAAVLPDESSILASILESVIELLSYSYD